ncbi:MAG: hypothetical protein ACTHU0_00170 [Kofleriaceae bacterium]
MKRPVTFTLSVYASVDLDVDDLWPGGDAPENPTAADVAKVVAECGGVRGAVADWNLENHLELTITGNDTTATINP